MGMSRIGRLFITGFTLVFVIGLGGASPLYAVESLSFVGSLPPDPKPLRLWGRDVFAPTVAETGGIPLKLTAIFYNPETPSAIIDGEIVYKGGSVKGRKVLDIGPTHVILQGKEGTIRLEIINVTGSSK